jgi:hypothetical protein
VKPSAGILDNKSLGTVVSKLKGNRASGCTLSVVSALFSLYAYDIYRIPVAMIMNEIIKVGVKTKCI